MPCSDDDKESKEEKDSSPLSKTRLHQVKNPHSNPYIIRLQNLPIFCEEPWSPLNLVIKKAINLILKKLMNLIRKHWPFTQTILNNPP